MAGLPRTGIRKEQVIGLSSLLLHMTVSLCHSLQSGERECLMVLGMLGNQEMAQDKERMLPVPSNGWHVIGMPCHL